MPRPVERLLGRIAVAQGVLSPERLQEALARQQAQSPEPPLGVVLLEAGWLTAEQIADLLAAQATSVAAFDPRSTERACAWRFGERAMRLGAITLEAMNRGLREQARRDEAGLPWAPLGEILVGQGTLTGDALARLLGHADAAAATVLQSPVPNPAEAATAEAAPPNDAPPTVLLADRTGSPAPGSADRRTAVLADQARRVTRDAAPRRTFGRYELVHELGRGGMGAVYKAWQPDLRTYVALKVMLAGDLAGDEQRERFRREAEAAARLHHPGIVAVHEFGVEDGRAYFTMDYVEGVSLDRLLDRSAMVGSAEAARPGLPAREAMRLAGQLAEAVHAAHQAGVIHRDLKPANVLLDADGRVRVTDFGLARLEGGASEGQTRTGTLLGTPAYMSPEQAGGRVRDVDARSDVYQVGAILYELLTGRPPFSGETAMDVVMRVAREEAPRPRHWAPALSPEAEAVCCKAMAREKADRYATARELAEDCARWLTGEAVTARPEGRWRAWSRALRRRRAWVAAVTAAAVVAGAAALSAWQARAERAARERADAERQRLAASLLDAVRTQAAETLGFALELRRAGVPVAKGRAALPRLEAAVRQAEEAEPRRPEPRHHLGVLLRALQRFDDAERAQARALELDPEFLPARYERAVLGARALRERVRGLRRQAAAARAEGGGGPPADFDLVERDSRARELRARLSEDLAQLERAFSASGTTVPAARVETVRGLSLACAARSDEERGAALACLERALADASPPVEAVEECATLHAARIGPRGPVASWEAARAVLDRGLEADRGYVPFHLLRGRFFVDQAAHVAGYGGRAEELFAAAAAEFAEALRLDPDDRDARLERAGARALEADLREQAGEDARALHRAAEEDLDARIDQEPDAGEARVLRGRVRLSRARAEARRGVDPAPRLAAAEQDLSHAIQRDAGDAEAVSWRGRVRLEIGIAQSAAGADPAEALAAAIADLERAVALEPDGLWARYFLGGARARRGVEAARRGRDPEADWRAAREILSDVLRLEPTLAGAWSQRGVLEASWGLFAAGQGLAPDGHLDAALADLTRALELRSGDAGALHHRAQAFLLRGRARAARKEDPGPDYEAARIDARAADAAGAGDPEALRQRVDACLVWATHQASQGKDPSEAYLEARDALTAALQRDPAARAWRTRRAEVQVAWGTARWKRREDPSAPYADAIADWNEVERLDPEGAEAAGQRGLTRLRWAAWQQEHGLVESRRLVEAALTDLGTAIRRAPRDAEWRIRRGNVRLALGHAAEAVADYEAALHLDPAVLPRVKENLEEARQAVSARPGK